MEKKTLGLFSRSTPSVLVGSLIATVIVSFLWSFVESQEWSYKNAWIQIIEMLLGALIIGWVVGYLAGNAKTITLWWAALFAALGGELTKAFVDAGGPWDHQIREAVTQSGISLAGVVTASIVLAILGVAGAAVAGGKK
jgi:hypothetical protein